LDHLGLRRAHILGYSLGAHIVAQLLTLHPERFTSAVLGGACGRRNWCAEDDARVAVEAAEMEQCLLRSQLLRLWPHDVPEPGETQLRERSARLLEGNDPLALAALRRSNCDQVVTDAQMAAVRIATLGIVGSEDPYLQRFRELQALMPELEVVVLDGA